MYSTRSNTPAFTSRPRPLPVAWFVGVPWVSGGRDPAHGLDCWGLVLAAARECFDLALPDYQGYADADDAAQTAHLFAQRDAWAAIAPNEERAGDVIVLRLGSQLPVHAGLVVGYGLMLHSLSGRDACLERYRSRAWADRIEGFYRWSQH
jgi:cell wall-associated NlpC family hydrolase